MTITINYPRTPDNKTLKFENIGQREINRLITHASNCRQRDGEVDIVITVSE